MCYSAGHLPFMTFCDFQQWLLPVEEFSINVFVLCACCVRCGKMTCTCFFVFQLFHAQFCHFYLISLLVVPM
jgi:hypothetical protein